MKCLIIILFIIATPIELLANNYYVTQSGSGNHEGISRLNAYSVDEHNKSTFSPGDTIYFSGTITSEIAPPSSGSAAGGYIIYDGLESGKYDAISEENVGQAVVQMPAESNNYGFILWKSAYGTGNGKDYIIMQDFEISGTSHAIYAASGSDHLIIRRNYIHDALNGGISIITDWIDNISCDWVTVGGALGDGNVVKNTGYNTSGADVRFAATSNFICSYNHLYATPDRADGEPDDRGIDGIVPLNVAHNGLIEYNTIHSHNDSYGSDAKGEDGIDIKDDNGEYGCYNIIIRYNNIYDHKYQSNIHPQTMTHKLYIYGNRLTNSNWGSVYIKEGKCGDGCKDVPYHIYVFSNLMFKERDAASRIHSDTGGTDKPLNNIFFYNNTFSENGIDDHGTIFTHITADMDPTSLFIKNNIFIKSRPGYSLYQERQLNLNGVQELDFNRYYWPGKTSQVYIGSTSVKAIGSGLAVETHGSEGDPGLVNWANGDFRIAKSDSPVVGAGDKLTKSIDVVTIQGVEYEINFIWGLDPNRTDFSTIPPTVRVLSRDDYGAWDLGAFVCVEKAALIKAPTELSISK